MKLFYFFILTLSLNSLAALASTGKPVEMWCGSPTTSHSYSSFPYTTSIRKYASSKHHGKFFEVAIIYKNGRQISKNYVYKSAQGMGISYLSADSDFILKLPSQESLDSTANFRAILHQRDGDTLIANGEILCHRPKRS